MFFGQGGFHMNLNVLSKETLEDAMEHPEKYPQLTIRVSGYAVNFVRLTREQQLDVIRRTFHGQLLRAAPMLDVGMVEVGSRYDLRAGIRPTPGDPSFDGAKRRYGWVHSYETGSTVDGPGMRVMLFMSGCLLRCQYCHNPDTWHLKDGTGSICAHAIAGSAISRRRCAPWAAASPSPAGSRWCSRLYPRLFRRGQGRWACIPRSIPRVPRPPRRRRLSRSFDLVLLDIKSGDPDTYRRVTGVD